MSTEGEQLYCSVIGRVEAIVQKRARKYNLPAMDPDDLLQEGRLAAAYAVDTYSSERGRLDGYVSAVVDKALKMVASEMLAQRRQPFIQRLEEGKWVKVPVSCEELQPELTSDGAPLPFQVMLMREERRKRDQDKVKRIRRLNGLQLSDDARTVLSCYTDTPPELWVTIRNRSKGRMRIDGPSIAVYLGWERSRIQRASRELKDALYTELGVGNPILIRPKVVPHRSRCAPVRVKFEAEVLA